MIVAATADGRLRLITQPDHAHLAAEILGLWRADGFPEHPRREELLFAVREHDNGWREADAAPRIDPRSARPADFLAIPDALRREIWERGVGRYRSRRPYAAALIAEHALTLFARTEGETSQEISLKLRKAQAESLEHSHETQESLATDYPWLQLADDLSLWLCTGRAALGRHDREGRRGESAWELGPFPFAGATTFRVPCRHIPDLPYPSDAAFAVAAASARWEDVEARLRPLSTARPAW